jgi:hypothetical protein
VKEIILNVFSGVVGAALVSGVLWWFAPDWLFERYRATVAHDLEAFRAILNKQRTKIYLA